MNLPGEHLLDPANLAILADTLAHALDGRRGADADEVLADIGWADLLEASPRQAVALTFTALGTSNTRARCLADVVAHGLGLPAGTAVVLPAYATADPPGSLAGGVADVDGFALAASADGPTIAVPCASGSVVTVRTADLDIVPAPGIDATLALHRVTGRGPIVGAPSAGDWDTAVALGRLALAHEVTAASRVMLHLAVEHARGRVQFGRAIASFQAVRHKLAEVLVAVEAAEAGLEAAHDAPGPLTATLAKVLAGRAAALAGVHCQQVLAGIGFTREHDHHRYLQRTIALDGVLGSTGALTRQLGADLIAAGAVPRVVEL